MATFGDFVREKRLAKGINLRALAKAIDIVPAYMSDIEKNHRYPPVKEKIFGSSSTCVGGFATLFLLTFA